MPQRKLPPAKPARKKPADKRSIEERCLAMCARIAGGLSLRKASHAEGLDHSDFLARVKADTDMEVVYRAALATKAELRIESLTEEADRVMTSAKRLGSQASAFVAAFGHKVKIVQWTAEKHAPKVYGQKVDLNHGGSVTVSLASGDAGLL